MSGQELPSTLRVLTVWLLVGLAVFLGFQYVLREREQAQFSSEGGTVRLSRGPDGHYHWPGRINGRRVDFLVDTGASGTAISQSLARELDLKRVGRVQSSTAGGVVEGDVVIADIELEGGVRIDQARAVALPALGDRPLLGMSVLGRMNWQQRDGMLVIDTGSRR